MPSAGLAAIPPHRVATHLNAMRVMIQPVEDAVGHGRVADLFVPADLIIPESRSRPPGIPNSDPDPS